MTITFRVDDGHNVLSPSPAVITPDQLGALRDLLSDHTARTGDAMVIPIHGDLRLGLGLNPDGAPELEVANGNAFALLASLGLDEESCGAIPLSQLRQRLMDPRIRRRLDEDPQMSRYVEALTTMAALKPVEGEYHLAWA